MVSAAILPCVRRPPYPLRYGSLFVSPCSRKKAAAIPRDLVYILRFVHFSRFRRGGITVSRPIMRKSRIETAATRVRIVEAASREFRRNGIETTGLPDLMAAAGMTRGGFYKHFTSKEQVAAEACEHGIDALVSVLTAAMESEQGEPSCMAAIKSYLSMAHRNETAEGCPFAALGAELGRANTPVREVASDGLARLARLFLQTGREHATDAERQRATVTVAAMIGAITMARIATDEQAARQILDDMRQHLAAIWTPANLAKPAPDQTP